MSAVAHGPYLTGEDLLSITIEYGARDSSGTYSYSAPANIWAYINEVAPTMRRQSDDIRPIWSRYENQVIHSEGHSARVSCLQAASGAQVLRQVAGYDIARVTWEQGDETYQGVYAVLGWEGGVRNRGGNMVSLDLGPVGGGTTANITVTP